MLSLDLGSVLLLWELTHYSSGRDPYLDGKVFGAKEILACTGQQLIPDLIGRNINCA